MNSPPETMPLLQDGDVIPQKWHYGFVVFAYAMAYLGSYSSIRILEHGLWRSEKERENATLLSRYPRFAMAFVLGSCAVWSMHFVGSQAVQLEGVEMCYNMPATLASLFSAVGGIWAGVAVAGWDVFAGPDRVELLKQLVQHDQFVSHGASRKLARLHIHRVALFDMLHWIAAGSCLAAMGALTMHYIGMIAMAGPFRREWSFGYVAASCVVGVVVCFAGFWILFRPLHWKVEKSWYRISSAAVIAAAVTFLHFLGMRSVTYIADSSMESACDLAFTIQGWRHDQFQVLCVAVAVPFVAFVVEHTISSELRSTYRRLEDVRLEGSSFELSEVGGKATKPDSSRHQVLSDEWLNEQILVDTETADEEDTKQPDPTKDESDGHSSFGWSLPGVKIDEPDTMPVDQRPSFVQKLKDSVSNMKSDLKLEVDVERGQSMNNSSRNAAA